MWSGANNYGMRRQLPGQGFDPGEYAQGPRTRHNYGHVGAETIGVNPASIIDDTLDFNLNPKTGAYETAAQMGAKKPGFWGRMKGKGGRVAGLAGTAANLALPAMMFAPMLMGGGDSGGGGGGEVPLSSVDIRNLDYNREMQRQMLLSQSVRGF